MESVLTSELVAGHTYRVTRTPPSGGFVVRDPTDAAAALLSSDAKHCATRDHRWTLELRHDRLAWKLALIDDASGRQAASSRPQLRPATYRITDRSQRHYRLTRRPISKRWTLGSDRGVIARMTFQPLFAQQGVTFIEGETELPVGEITLNHTLAPLENTAAIVLLAIATVHADSHLPAVSPGA